MKLSVRTITERFRESGRKVTPQRVAVFETLCERRGHPTVDQIYQEVRKRFPMISLNTVYQTMEALAHLKVVSPVGHSLEAARYETDPALIIIRSASPANASLMSSTPRSVG